MLEGRIKLNPVPLAPAHYFPESSFPALLEHSALLAFSLVASQQLLLSGGGLSCGELLSEPLTF